MRPAPLLAALGLALAACGEAPVEDTPRSVNAVGDATWKLVEMNGADPGHDGILLRIAGGFLNGQGPCNTINANYVGEAPAFEIETLITTKMVCDRLGLENRVVEALLGARRAVVANGRLTLSGEGSATLVFVPV